MQTEKKQAAAAAAAVVENNGAMPVTAGDLVSPLQIQDGPPPSATASVHADSPADELQEVAAGTGAGVVAVAGAGVEAGAEVGALAGAGEEGGVSGPLLLLRAVTASLALEWTPPGTLPSYHP